MENYERKYKDALERASKLKVQNPFDTVGQMVEHIFPELQEQKSEDEKIRKEIYVYLDWLDGRKACAPKGNYTIRQMLDWLEKQGKQQSISALEAWKDMRLEVYQQASGNRHEPNYSDDSTKMFSLNDIDEIIEKISEQKLDDKIEPKFKVGDWFVNNNRKDVFLIKSINTNGYCTLEDIKGNIISPCLPPCESDSHIWTIEDAKDGDVLTNGEFIVIFKQIIEPKYRQHIEAYIGLDLGGNIQITSESWLLGIDKAMPATKEQRDMLFQKMKEVGYKWDSEKKELKKIEPKTLDADKVIAWLVANICHFEYYVELFKKDFGL